MIYPRILAAIFVATLAAAGSAHAATVNYTGTDYMVGTVADGQSGKVSTTLIGTTVHDFISGYLPSDSEIVFTYTAKAPLTAGTDLYAYGKQGSHSSTATAEVTSGGGTSSSSSSNSSIIVASAFLTGSKTGTTTIINNSSTSAFFISMLESASKYGGLVVAYTVSSLAAVPLPAALPMFALVLVAMVAFGYKQKARARSIVG